MSSTVVAEHCPQCGASLPGGDSEHIACSYCRSSLVRRRVQSAPEAEVVEESGSTAGAWGLRRRRISYHLGEYIVTDDPSFDSNMDSNVDWMALERRQ